MTSLRYSLLSLSYSRALLVCQMYLFHAEVGLTDDPSMSTRCTTSCLENDIGRQNAAQQMVYPQYAVTPLTPVEDSAVVIACWLLEQW